MLTAVIIKIRIVESRLMRGIGCVITSLSISDFCGGIPASRQRFEQLVYMYISRQLCLPSRLIPVAGPGDGSSELWHHAPPSGLQPGPFLRLFTTLPCSHPPPIPPPLPPPL